MQKKRFTNFFTIFILCIFLTSCSNFNKAKGVSESKTEQFQVNKSSNTQSTKKTDEDVNDKTTLEHDEHNNVNEQKNFTESLTVPSNVNDSIIKLDKVLNETAGILNEIEKKSGDSTNAFVKKEIKSSRNKLIDLYTASAESFKDISLYRYYDKQDSDSRVKDEIYTYGTIYQDAMYNANNAFYQIIFGRGNTEGFKQTKAAFELRQRKANDLLNSIKNNTKIGPASDYSNIFIDQGTDAILLLDTLWIYHQRLWQKQGEYINQNNTFSKLPVDDALEEIDPLIGNAKTAMELLKNFSKQNDLERQDDWNLEDQNGIIDNWHTAADDQLYAIQIFGNKDKLEDYYGGKSYIPTNDMIKYDIRYQIQFLDYKEFQWQYTRGRDFLRSQQKAYTPQ